MNVHFIESSDKLLAYFPDTKRFFSINSITKDLINFIINNRDVKDIEEKFNIDLEEYYNLKRKLINYSTPINNIKLSDTHEKRLNRLVLNISNTCNLKCKYCYANGGSYKSDKDIMTKEMAEIILNEFYSFFDAIDTVQIFGGEPTINMPVVEFICKYIFDRNKRLKEKTKIGIVTNATIVNDKLINLINKYDMQVTVSYDGNPKVNDIMRVYPNGMGTSNIILSNIKKLRNETNQPTTIEVTFNQNHINNEVKIIDIIKFINDEVGNIPLHIVPAGGESNCDYALKDRNEFINSVDDIFFNYNNKGINIHTYSLVQKIISSLVNKTSSDYICSAGISTLSVSIKGDIYPCFMFTDDINLNLGNITDENVFYSERFSNIIKKFHMFNKNNIKKCKNCFIKNICTGCLGMNYLENGNAFNISDSYCSMLKKMTEKVILNLLEIKEKSKAGELNELIK